MLLSPLGGARGYSRDLDLVHASDSGAFGDVGRQQRERVLSAFRFDFPPDRVAAGAARSEGGLVAKWAWVSLEGGEDDAALARLVMVLEYVTRHGSSLPPGGCADIGG